MRLAAINHLARHWLERLSLPRFVLEEEGWVQLSFNSEELPQIADTDLVDLLVKFAVIHYICILRRVLLFFLHWIFFFTQRIPILCPQYYIYSSGTRFCIYECFFSVLVAVFL